MKQVRDNPTVNQTINMSTYVFENTGASGTITASGSTDWSSLTSGDSIFLGLGVSGASGGYEHRGEYFVLNVSSGVLQVTDTKENALGGIVYTTTSGNAGSGMIYPNYKIGGVFDANVSGDVYVRGIGNRSTGWNSFSLRKMAFNGASCPYMIKDITSSGTTAGSIVSWSN